MNAFYSMINALTQCQNQRNALALMHCAMHNTYTTTTTKQDYHTTQRLQQRLMTVFGTSPVQTTTNNKISIIHRTTAAWYISHHKESKSCVPSPSTEQRRTKLTTLQQCQQTNPCQPLQHEQSTVSSWLTSIRKADQNAQRKDQSQWH
jgi:hypothetical protein